MKDMYEPLELHEVKEQVAKHASFSLGKQLIRQMMPRFDALWVRRELARVKRPMPSSCDLGTCRLAVSMIRVTA
ncbi:MAG: hypothetical protein ACLRL6_02565 [Clostridium sp.]